MNAIQQFLDTLKSPNKSFGIKGLDLSTCKAYPYEEYSCEIALLHQCSFEGDRDNVRLSQTFKEIFAKEYLELTHPIHTHILTRAVLGFNNPLVQNGGGYNSFVFFIDKDNQYPWILVNENMFARILITPENLFLAKDLFGVQDFAKWILWAALAEIPKIARNLKAEDLKFCDKKFAINLGITRPYHFFRDDLYWFYKLNLQDCNVLNTPMFFKTKEIKNIIEDDRLGIRPALLCSPAYFEMQINTLENIIVSQSLANNVGGGGAEEMYSLTLWLGIPGERRIWLEQWEGIPLILKNLSLYFPSIKVYVDGMTAYDGERIEVTSNLEAFWKIVENTKEAFEVSDSASYKDAKQTAASLRGSETGEASVAKATDPHLQIHNAESRPQDSKNSCVIYGARGEQIAFKSLSGYDYRTKICYCAMCDIAISEISTTALTPFNFCKKGGVGFYSAVNEYQVKGYKTKGRYFINTRYLITHRKGSATADFHIPPEHLYNLAAESLEELSLEGKLANFGKDNPLKMHRLSVPPVELYAKLYELEKKTQISLRGNRAEQEILEKIESQKKLLEMQKLLCESAQRSEIAPNTKEAPKPRGAKERVHRHLAYKLGVALIVCSKSLYGYIRMPYVLSHIKAQHRFEQEKYQKAVTRNPALKLPKLESYADYEDALKEQQCYTYKLGAALMEADKTWLKGGYLWFYLESKRLKREFEREKK